MSRKFNTASQKVNDFFFLNPNRIRSGCLDDAWHTRSYEYHIVSSWLLLNNSFRIIALSYSFFIAKPILS